MKGLVVKNFKIERPEFSLSADSFSVAPGQRLTLDAPSGFGKTTFIRGILGLDALTSGEIELKGERIEQRPPHLRQIGVVFQDHLLFSHLNAFQNAIFGLKLRGQVTDQALARVEAGFKDLGIASRMHAPIQELSGGERQRVALLRATVFLPQMLILDEPLKGLDEEARDQVLTYLRQFLSTCPVPMIWVSHQGGDPLPGVRLLGKERSRHRHFEIQGQ